MGKALAVEAETGVPGGRLEEASSAGVPAGFLPAQLSGETFMGAGEHGRRGAYGETPHEGEPFAPFPHAAHSPQLLASSLSSSITGCKSPHCLIITWF